MACLLSMKRHKNWSKSKRQQNLLYITKFQQSNFNVKENWINSNTAWEPYGHTVLQ